MVRQGAAKIACGMPRFSDGRPRRRSANTPDCTLNCEEPAFWLWERLSGRQQDQVEAVAKAELASLESLLVQQGGASCDG